MLNEFEILGVEKDKLGIDTCIKYSEHFVWTPAYTFFLREIADAVDNQLLPPYSYWNEDNCAVIWAEQNNEIVGHIMFDCSYIHYPVPHLSIILTGVNKNHRQKGIHQIMNKYYEEIARRMGCSGIRATVHRNNHVRFISAEKDNLYPGLYLMSKKIK